MTQQRLFIVNGDPKNCLYINSGTSTSNLSNKELLIGLIKLDRTLKIQSGDEPIHILTIRSLHHLILPISTCHYSENTISNVLLDARLSNEYHIIYNIQDDNAIYMWNKEYAGHTKFPRDHKFNLYYMDINEPDMDKHYCPNTVKQVPKVHLHSITYYYE